MKIVTYNGELYTEQTLQNGSIMLVPHRVPDGLAPLEQWLPHLENNQQLLVLGWLDSELGLIKFSNELDYLPADADVWVQPYVNNEKQTEGDDRYGSDY